MLGFFVWGTGVKGRLLREGKIVTLLTCQLRFSEHCRSIGSEVLLTR